MDLVVMCAILPTNIQTNSDETTITRTQHNNGPILARLSPEILHTTALTLSARTVACLTELLSAQVNIHNWPSEGVRGEGSTWR